MFLLKKNDKDSTPTATRQETRRRVAPLVNISESEQDVILTADMPGVPADGVDVRLHGDVLTLTGTTAIKEPESANTLWREFGVYDYERVFRVGQDIDSDKVEANIKDGVLRVKLHKRAAAAPKKIDVKAG